MTVPSLSQIYSEGGATLVTIFGMSVLALGLGLERLSAIWIFRKHQRRGVDRILEQLQEGNLTMARAVNTSMPKHPATELFTRILADVRPSLSEVRRAQARIVREARRRLWLLGSMGALAPFVGLFGTVLGVMTAFEQMGAQGAGGFQVVSGGISEALITTAGGIFVGVEAVLFFNYAQVCAAEYAAELREAVEEIFEQMAESDNGVPRAKAG